MRPSTLEQALEVLHQQRLLLQEYVARFDTVDNGYCALCGKDRKYVTTGHLLPCPDSHCLSARTSRVLKGFTP